MSDKVGTEIIFRAGGDAPAILGPGWHDAEPGGTWTKGRQSHVRLPIAEPGRAYECAIRHAPYVYPPVLPAQDVSLLVNGQEISRLTVAEPGVIRFLIPAELTRGSGGVDLSIQCHSAVAPFTIRLGGDLRVIGLMVSSLELRPTGETPAAAEPAPEPAPAQHTQLFLEVQGYCPICQAPRRLFSGGPWLRGDFKCEGCNTIPRERALMVVLDTYYPTWRQLQIHESSPGWGGLSSKLKAEASGYSWSHYDPAVPTGAPHPNRGWQNENLEALSFPDASFDLIITQDVFEHLMDPCRAATEIARVLKPGGAHICTVPMVNGAKPSQRRARLVNGQIEHLMPASYHGNPVDASGSLCTVDWGFDITDHLDRKSCLHSTIVSIDDLSRGIRAAVNEVIVMRKTSALAEI